MDRNGRERCSECQRAVSVCLCAELPSSPLPTTRTTVVVLQHPHETRHKLSTLPLLAKCLANCHILHGRRFRAGASPLLDFFSSHHASPFFHSLLLFPTPAAQLISSWYDHVMLQSQDLGASADPGNAVACLETLGFTFPQHVSSVACDAQEGTRFPRILLIAVDATWQHAQEMIKASAPFLDKFVVPVCLPFDAKEEGACMANSELIMRKEPFKGCMTTLEAISCCLKVLEPNGGEIHNRLTHVLRCMVQFQASNIASHKVRVNKQSKSTPVLSRDMSKYS